MQRRHLRTRLVHARTNARHRREAAAAAHVPYAFVTTTTTTSPLGLVAGGGKGLVVVVVVMMNALRAIRGWWSARFWRARVSPRGGRGGGGPRRARPCVACWRYGTACIRHLEAAGAEEGLVEHVLAVGHADDEDVVERVHPVDVRQQLVHHAVPHPCENMIYVYIYILTQYLTSNTSYSM